MIKRIVAAGIGLALLTPAAAQAEQRAADVPNPSGTAVATESGAGSPSGNAPTSDIYRVLGVDTKEERTSIARTGSSIEGVDEHTVTITALPRELSSVRRLGFETERLARTQDFPPEDSGYHDYGEIVAELDRIASEHPDLSDRFTVGQTYEGRDIPGIKISDNAEADENEPEVLFTANQHAREHLTPEMALYIADMLTESYGSDSRVTELVDSREVWILPMVNPDGVEYDIDGSRYRSWRKNRQPNEGAVGTDLNRNWAYQWGCCGGSSGNPSSNTYRGPSPESAPEVSAVADFVRGRVVDGEQQIEAHIDFHTYSELVLWPMGYTYDDTGSDMSRDAHETFVTIGEEMAATNDYTPQQSSDLYITDGSVNDWMWAEQGIFSFTFEMYPESSSPGFYPPDEVIDRETERNREAVLSLLDYSDCPYSAIGEEEKYCGGGNGAPTARFSAECSDSEAVCSFDASATRDPDGSVRSYEWTFGDGATGTGVRPSHSYAEAGEYRVTLTVTDDAGNTDEVTKTVDVGTPPGAGEPPSASFIVNCDYGECSFDAGESTDPDGDIVEYGWNFGDGDSGSGVTTDHAYPAATDSYTVELTVTDGNGHSDSATRGVDCWNFGGSAYCFAS
ncbi:PKD domain-containing protein [Actinopolyspora lacussalsi subsp. righensis]|uniref:Zinc carboxypeptidase n=1 Tax=Actinopolyspora righensis TaxID=995060 RepID=A0A1I7AG10_9ACTN|nr:M14 family zinc carboxypeptidase [Actinopolyspora righensis]SFT73857.1 PKD domain-containing protein [Actinopolyspora righensis]